MSFATSFIFFMLSFVSFPSEAESSFAKEPPSPSLVLEGDDLFLQWNYTLGESLYEASIDLVTNGPIARLSSLDLFLKRPVFIVPAYVGRVAANITDTQTNLTFLSVNRNDTGRYRIQLILDNVQRTEVNSEVTITVLYPPEFTSVSDDVVLIEGEGDPSVTLECTADGEPTPNITWTRVYANGSDGNELETGNHFALEKNRTNSGTYRCTAYNGIGTSLNHTVKVEVNFKPEIIKPLVNDSTVCEGDVISITCSAVSRPAVHTYQLFENGALVVDGNSSAGVEMLRRDIKEGNFSYRCVANNTIGTTEETVNIAVRVPSKVYPLENITVIEGENRTLTCNASGSPVPTVTWTRVSTNNQSNGPLRYLTNISRNDAGEYKCEAINDCGNSSASTFLTVRFKPENFKFTVSESTVCQGAVVTFNCSADGNPPVDTYQLLENGTPVSDGSNRLGMWSRNMSSGGEFIYKCMANNSAGTAYSMSLTVTVNVTSSIQEILDQNVTEGNNLTLTCNVSGTPPLKVSWIEPDGQRSDGSVLKLSNISRNQNGTYRCEASNYCGNATETASIDVQYKPENVQLMNSAMNNKACKGEVISFDCSADANPAVTYQLFENETAILNTSATGMWYRTLENEGTFVYKCMASNMLGSMYSTNVILTVNVPSSIIHITQHQNATEGDNVTLMCNVSGVPPPAVSWITPNGARFSKYKLEVTNINRSQAGEYKCEASNECGNATNMTRIDVFFKPENVQLNSSAMNDKACKGKVISFNCSADAFPAVTSYQLFENETAILSTSATGMWSKTLENEGVFVYKCVANNSLGSEYSMSVTVSVNVPSSIIHITQHQSATEGNDVTLMCNVSGVPPPTVSWMTPNGTRVSGYKLEVKNINRSQAGEYKCEASNECGSATDMTRIDVQYKPENVQFTSSATDNKACKDDMITFNCSADADPSVTSYQLFENDTAIVGVNREGMWNIKVSAGGVFMYRCVANNSIGSGVSSYVMVTVNVPSSIEAIQDQNVTEGETVTLTCTAFGMPPPNLSWIKPNNESVAVNVLELVNISRNEAGEYRCEANNECGNATEMTSIDVHFKPENVQFTLSVTDDKACKGDMISFHCSADANPSVTSYQLFENDTAILDVNHVGVWNRSVSTGGLFMYKCVANNSIGTGVSSYVMVTVNVPSTIETIRDQNVTEGETKTLTCTVSGMPQPNVFWIKPNNERVAENVLELVNTSRNEAGEYRCEASNECGNATEMTRIDVHYKPENVQLRTSVMNNIAILGDTITFNCSADAKPAVTSYQLYKNGTAVEAKLSGMWKETLNRQGVFVYKCMAKNTLGSTYSEDVTLTVNGCGKQCTDGRSCRKFGVKYVCICPEGKTGKNCEDEAEPKKNFVVGIKITIEFKQVYEDLDNPETKALIEDIKINIMIEFQGTGLVIVKVVKLRRGSVLADLELTFNKSVDQGSVDALLTQAAKAGKLGDMDIEDVVVGGTFPDTAKEDCGTFFEGEDCKKAKPGLIVLCIVGGVAVLAIIVAIIAYGLHKKKSDGGSFSNGNYERPDPVGTAGSVERMSSGNGYGNVNRGYQYDGTNGHSQEMVTFKGTAANPSQTPGITLNDSSMTKKSQPGEGLYADLGEFHQKAPAPPTTPVKMPPEYEKTEYAELSHFLRAPVKTDDEKENDEKEEESNVEKNSPPEKGEDPSSDMGEDPFPDMGQDPFPDMGEDASPDMGDAGNGNSSGSVGFVVSI